MSSKITAKKTLNSNTIIDTNNEISEESYSRLVKMDFYFNGKKLSYEYLTDNLFQIVYDALKKSLGRNYNLEKYDLIYKLEKITFNEETLISDIISYDDKNPSFILRRKPEFVVPVNYKNLTVSIENFPSFMDLSEQINKFLAKFKIEIDFDVNYIDNCCKITFVKSEIAFSFINFMTKLKFSNNYYKHMKINLHYKYIQNYNHNKNKSFIFHSYLNNKNKNDKQYFNKYNKSMLFKKMHKKNLLNYLDNNKSIHFNDRYFNSLFSSNKNYNTINYNLENETIESENSNSNINSQYEKEIINFRPKRNSNINKQSKRIKLNLPKLKIDNNNSFNTVEYDSTNTKKRYFRFRTGQISEKFNQKENVKY